MSADLAISLLIQLFLTQLLENFGAVGDIDASGHLAAVWFR